MAMIKVYRFEFLNPMIGRLSKSACLGTKEHIERFGGWVIQGTELEVDASQIGATGWIGAETYDLPTITL